MKRPNPREAWRDLCAGLRDDDGIDPRLLDSHRSATNNQLVTGRLCKQVERVIQLALLGSADAQLRELSVAGVSPAPDLTRLQVSLGCVAASAADIDALRDKLARYAGFLRSEVAREVNRKRTPTLAFVLLPGDGAAAHEEVRP